MAKTTGGLSGAASGATIGSQILPGWGTAIGAGIGGLAGLLGSNEEHIGPGDLYPDWMKGIRQDLGAQIGELDPLTAYEGDWIAGMNPMLQNTLGDMYGFGQQGGLGNQLTGASSFAGLAGLGAMGQGLDYMSELRGQGPGAFNYDQGTYNQIMGNLAPGMQNAFDLGAQDIQRNFDWNMLPGLNMGNALAGGQGNTKFGQSGALGQAMTDKNIADFGSGLWQNASNQANLGAMQSGLNNLSSSNLLQNQLLGSYGDFGRMGADLVNQGFGMGVDTMGLGLNAGQIQQGYDQSIIDADKQKWNINQAADQNLLTNQLAMMKQFEMGSQPSVSGMSPLAGITEGAQVGGMFGDLFADVWGNKSSQDIPDEFGGGWQGESYGLW